MSRFDTARARWIALGVAIALPLLGLLGWWWFTTHEWVEEEVELPAYGEMTYNPLFVLGLSLREAGWTVEMRQRLQPDAFALSPGDTVLVFNDPRRLSRADSDALLAFVEAGGHLIVRTPPPERFSPEAPAPLLDALGVQPGGMGRCEPMQVEGEERHVEFCQGQPFDLATRPRIAWEARPRDAAAETADTAAGDDAGDTTGHADAANGDGRRHKTVVGKRGKAGVRIDVPLPAATAGDADADDGPARGRYVHARIPHGRGSVDVLADLDFLANEGLRDGAHVVLARQLFAPGAKSGTAHLLYAAEMPSFWRWLFGHSWMAWGPLALALLAWLWARMVRFGPILPSPPVERRSLLEHVAASGEHTWRYGYAHVLHAAVRTAFMARLRRRDPLAAGLEGEAQAALLAERFGLSTHEIRAALATPPAGDATAFRSRIATLIRLRNQL